MVEQQRGIPCVIYAAKSTQDTRGSIPGQLQELHATIDTDPRRWLVAEYRDEAYSAYRRDRGPGLADATQHCEDLAAEHGIAELWAQHSDRLARGDGRHARHTVEVALWALKHDVRVRTLQDPDTFRDLLYAVVTGQRNNEDSRRRALSSQAGRKRAIARGGYVGHLPDGYKVHRELDSNGELHTRMVIDPERRVLFELIFRLALRGRNCGHIAKAVSDRGWLTKPVKRCDLPRPFDVGKIYELLQNPRYAGLSVYKGEVLARGYWPAYVTERQQQRVVAGMRRAREGWSRGPLDAYLLAGLALCGRCGHRLRVLTGRVAVDGTRPRGYVCGSHRSDRGRAQCPAPPVDAHVIEAMLIASLPTLLAHADRDAEHIGDGDGPYAAAIVSTVRSQRHARELADIERLHAWVGRESEGRTETTRRQVRALNRLLQGWFTDITVDVGAQTVVITATRRHARPTAPTVARIDRAGWARTAPPGHRQLMPANKWAPPEMLGALQAWADEHGSSPRQVEWKKASPAHPSSLTIRRYLGTWNQALRKAGLHPVAPPARHPWTDQEILAALKASARRDGRAPTYIEWVRGAPERPGAQTVYLRFGSWNRALSAAGLQAPARLVSPRVRWDRDSVIAALETWTREHGRPPTTVDWMKASANHPTTCTARKRFGSWQHALEAAHPAI